MDTRSIVREIRLDAPPEKVFAVLHTPSAVKAWWCAAQAIIIPAPGGAFAATWGADEDAPDYMGCATITVFEPPFRLTLANFRSWAHGGRRPYDADLATEFVVEPAGDGSLLRVTQSGFPAEPAAEEFFAGCEKGWTDALDSIRSYLAAA